MGCTATNLRIAYNFATDNASLNSFTSEVGNMYATNVQNQQPSKVWRSTDLATQEFVFELSELQQLSSIIVYNHNLSVSSEIELTIATDSGFTNIVFQETWSGYLPAYGWDEEPLGWDSIGWDGFDATVDLLNFFVKYFDPVVGLFVKVRISDTNSDGYMQAGRIIVTNSYEFDRNFGKDITLVYNDTSTTNTTESGATRSTQGVLIRNLTISLPNATEQDSNLLSNIFTYSKKINNIFIDCFPDITTTKTIRYKMLGFLINEFQEKRLTYQLQVHPSINIIEAK